MLRLRRDHRKLGQQLDLYSINDSGGAGLVFWHPKVRHLLAGTCHASALQPHFMRRVNARLAHHHILQGSMVRHLIETYWKDVHLRHGYELIYSPHIAKVRAATAWLHAVGR